MSVLHVLPFSLADPWAEIRGSSGCRLDLDLLSHLFGTVVGQAQAHDCQHHGYLVDGTVSWLGLHLAGNLPLRGHEHKQGKGQGSGSSENNELVCLINKLAQMSPHTLSLLGIPSV